MNITLLHGDDKRALLKRKNTITNALRKRAWKVTDLSDLNTSFQESLKANSLFGQEELYVHTKPSKITPTELKWLKENAHALAGNLLLVSEKIMPKGFIGKLPDESNVEEFILPKLVFQFLESFYPQNQNAIKLYIKLKESEDPQFILVMLSRHLRDLYWVKKGAGGMKVPDWRKNKLTFQANRFTLKRIGELIVELSKLDIDSKTGEAEIDSGLEMFIIRATNI